MYFLVLENTSVRLNTNSTNLRDDCHTVRMETIYSGEKYLIDFFLFVMLMNYNVFFSLRKLIHQKLLKKQDEDEHSSSPPISSRRHFIQRINQSQSAKVISAHDPITKHLRS